MSEPTAALTPGTAAYRRVLVALFFAGVATFAQLYAPQAVLPLVADDFGVAPATAALAVSVATLGLALAVIPWSSVSDRFGRIQAMAAGMIAAVILGALAPLASDIAVFLVLRFAEGVALGAVPAAALAYLSEEILPRATAAAAGSYIAGTTVGGLSGRLIAGTVADVLDWQSALWVTAAVCAASAVLFLLLVPRAQGFAPTPRTHRVLRRLAGQLREALRSAQLVPLYLQGFLLMGAFVAVYNYLGFHLIGAPFSLPTWVASLLFLAYLAGTIASPWAGSLASRFGRPRVQRGSILLAAVGAALLCVPSTGVILLGLVVFTAGFFGAHTVTASWSSAAAPSVIRAQSSSLYYLAYYAGSSLFGWALGFVFSGAGWIWFIAAVVLLCALAALLSLRTREAAEY